MYLQKLIIHELSTLYLEGATRAKSEGWWLFDAPSWFYQGYQEYLAIELGPDEQRDEIWNRLREHAGDCPEFEAADPTPCDDYIDGALLLKFMHERWGDDTLQTLLSRQEPTFEESLENALEIDESRLFEAWKSWLER